MVRHFEKLVIDTCLEQAEQVLTINLLGSLPSDSIADGHCMLKSKFVCPGSDKVSVQVADSILVQSILIFCHSQLGSAVYQPACCSYRNLQRSF